MARGEAVELGDDLVEQRHRARRAELLRELGEADKIAEQDGRLGDAVGDALVGPFLQPLGDGRRQDVGEQRVGLGPRLVGHSEGITHDQRDDAEAGDGGGNIEIGKQARLGVKQRALLRVEEPGGEVQREANRDHRGHEAEAGRAVDGEGDRRGDDVVDLNAGFATEGADEEEQSGVFDDGEQDGRGDVVDAVGERHEKRDHHQQQIDGDQMPVSMRVVIGEDDRVDDGKERDQERHRVDDGQPPAHGARIAFGAEFGECGQRPEPGEHGAGRFGAVVSALLMITLKRRSETIRHRPARPAPPRE